MRTDNPKHMALHWWLVFTLGLWGAPAKAQVVWEGTVLAAFYRSGNSQAVQDISRGSTRLSDGSSVPLRQWYSGNLQDLHITMLSPVNRKLGLLWGFGIGEAGEKYRIDPSLTLGFIYKNDLGPSSTLSLRLSAVVGGYMRERTCVADYGAIGGIQTVNCRLAATPMRPADTLDFLLDEAPHEKIQINLVYKYKF